MSIKTWLILLVFFIFSQTVAQAGEIYTTVFNIFESNITKRLLVLSGADGRIYKIADSENNKKILKTLLGKVVKITFIESGKEAIISSIIPVTREEVDPNVYDLNHFQYGQLRKFAPTDLQLYEDAFQVFKDMLNDGDKGRSQCFKRAHMWSYDMWSKLGINSQKIFIFYTKRYSILEEFEWWFHVAPMVIADGKEYVMDGTFMNKPVTVTEWKDRFIGKKVTCPVIEDYKIYEQSHWTRLCFLMKVPMYYFSPVDIEARDVRSVEKNYWVLEELQDARRAFKNYSTTYEGLDSGKPTIKY